MVKILAFAGSYNEQSITFRIIHETLTKAVKRVDSVEFEIIRPTDFSISSCRGCRSCFQHGKCLLDQYDDMSELRSKMLCADVILFASPVYVNHVSGITKTLIDRLSSWTHLFMFSGKKAITMATSEGSGHYDGISVLYGHFDVKTTSRFSLVIEQKLLDKALNLELSDYENSELHNLISRARNEGATKIISFFSNFLLIGKQIIAIIAAGTR